MKKIYISLLCVIGIFNLTAAQDFPEDLAGYLQNIIDDHISTTANKGVGVTVILADNNEWTGTGGIIYGSSAIDSSKLFDFGGQRHELVCATILKLQEEGLLSVNDSIGKYLTGIANINMEMPIKRFMNQTSGVGEYWSGENPIWGEVFSDRGKIWSLDEASTYIPEGDLAEDPSFDTQNSNHLALALLIEEITDLPVGEVINTKILNPIGINSSVFPVADFDETILNGVWRHNSGNAFSQEGFEQDAYMTSRVSWLGTIRDNARLTRALYNGEILNEENTAFMLVKTPGSESIEDYPIAGIEGSYGFGADLKVYDGKKAAGHAGNSQNMSLSYHFLDENFTISIVSNTFDSQYETAGLFGEIYNELAYFGAVGIESTLNSNDLSLNVYPNPATEYINIRLSGQDVSAKSVSIHDLSGRTIEMISNISVLSNNTIQVPLSQDLPRGYYLLKVNTDRGVYSKSFIISR